METLRSLTWLRWWLLAWFSLFLGAAVASPMVQPHVLELVCSSAGAVKLLAHSDDGTVELGAVGMDCPLCLLGTTGPVATHAQLPVLVPQADSPLFQIRIFSVVAMAAPPPARAPPYFS